jgi:predicted secreted protein
MGLALGVEETAPMDNRSFRVAVLATVSVAALLIMWLSQPNETLSTPILHDVSEQPIKTARVR